MQFVSAIVYYLHQLTWSKLAEIYAMGILVT